VCSSDLVELARNRQNSTLNKYGLSTVSPEGGQERPQGQSASVNLPDGTYRDKTTGETIVILGGKRMN
jgi:hypothetical protein